MAQPWRLSCLAALQLLLLVAYPLQVQPDELFMGASEFKVKFLEPITQGQQHDATRPQRQKMARQLSVLQDKTAVSTQRSVCSSQGCG